MSLINDEYKDIIDEVFECFESTERIVKKFEKEHGELSIPSINELRYVGYHFSVATQDVSDEEIRENVNKALNHCKRAKFDTYEASSTLVLERLKIFDETYSKVTETQTIMPNYVDDLLKIQEISDELEDMVSNKFETRELYYENVSAHHDALKKILQKFEIARPQIEVLVEANNAKKKSETRRFVATVTLSLMGLAMFMSFNLGFFDDFKNNADIKPVPENPKVMSKPTYKENNESMKVSLTNIVVKEK